MKQLNSKVLLAVFVASLGYLVDIYDMMIFSVVRTASLTDIGVPFSEITRTGLHILNWQLIGMLLGGLLWGILGDKKGRVTVLFGSIFLYSIANLANAWVATVEQYTALRFIAGIGLAGELGAGVTLVSEILPARIRGYGTMWIAGIGVFGAILAGVIGQMVTWKSAYIIGGFMGLGLLLVRVGILESSLYEKIRAQGVRRGSLWQLIRNKALLFRYVRCLFLAVPAWMLIGLFTTLSPELGRDMGLNEPLIAGKAVLFLNLGIALGDFASSLLSQWWKSRKKTIGFALVGLVTLTCVFILAPFSTVQQVLRFYFIMGIFAGYWAVFMMTTAEQFGTNLRATVATSTPNFVRAAIVPISMALQTLGPWCGYRIALGSIMLIMLVVALVSAAFIKESFHLGLDYVE